MSRHISLGGADRHENVSVRLMSYQLQRAVAAARKGDISDMCTLVRLAALYEQGIPVEIRLPELAARLNSR